MTDVAEAGAPAATATSASQAPAAASRALADRLSALAAAAFEQAGGAPEQAAQWGRVMRSDRPDLAPFQCNGAMAAAKALKQNPRAIAAAAAQILADQTDIAAVDVAGPGFLNITPAPHLIIDRAQALAGDARAGAGRVAEPQTIVLDFGGPNVAKPMHVGHLRSAVIGDCLQRLMKFRGDQLTSDIHLGDWGLQMGHLITELEDEQPDLPYFDAKASGPFPAEPPVTLDDLARLYPQASAKAKADPERLQRSRRATAALQTGRAGYRALLQHFIDVSVAGLKRDYATLNVSFDLWNGESDVDPLVPDVVQAFADEGHSENSEGAQIVRVARETDKKELAPLILVTSEGSALYATTDLATILDRVRQFNPDRILYVVDLGQSDHFEQVFRAADKIGWIGEDRLEHIKFGTVNGADGKRLRTREGGTFRLSDLVSEAQTRARAKVEEAGLAGNVSEDERHIIAEQVARAALRFADLQNVRTTNYVFDLDRFTSFEGKTGPYLLYAAVRMKSLLRKAVEEGAVDSLDAAADPSAIAPAAAEEIALVLEVDNFDAALVAAYDKRQPHHVCEHAFALAQAYSKFYAACPVLAAEDEASRASRLALTALTLKQLILTLDLLGIDTPERM